MLKFQIQPMGKFNIRSTPDTKGFYIFPSAKPNYVYRIIINGVYILYLYFQYYYHKTN